MQPLKRHAVVDFALREFRELPKAAALRERYPNSWHSDRSNRIPALAISINSSAIRWG